jgi:hypothetical protein
MTALPDVVPLALAGTSFPFGARHGLDSLFEYVVGLTLVMLGAVVLYQLGRYRSDYRYTGRISLVLGALLRTGCSGMVPPLVEG